MSELSENTLHQALALLGALLEEAGTSYSLVVAGGSALLAQKITARNTHDVDVIALDGGDTRAHPLPQTLTDTAAKVAKEPKLEHILNHLGHGHLLSRYQTAP